MKEQTSLDVSSNEFIAFIIAKIMSLPAAASIFFNHSISRLLILFYGFFIFLAVFLSIKKMLLVEDSSIDV